MNPAEEALPRAIPARIGRSRDGKEGGRTTRRCRTHSVRGRRGAKAGYAQNWKDRLTREVFVFFYLSFFSFLSFFLDVFFCFYFLLVFCLSLIFSHYFFFFQ